MDWLSLIFGAGLGLGLFAVGFIAGVGFWSKRDADNWEQL